QRCNRWKPQSYRRVQHLLSLFATVANFQTRMQFAVESTTGKQQLYIFCYYETALPVCSLEFLFDLHNIP
ncbi:hypothetical protein L9F63_011611, partial [Diploptera punctata]